MTILAKVLVDWTALLKIVIAAFAGGLGAAVFYGLVVRNAARLASGRSSIGALLVLLIGATCCIALVGLGVFAALQK
jgi:hypothetical protein